MTDPSRSGAPAYPLRARTIPTLLLTAIALAPAAHAQDPTAGDAATRAKQDALARALAELEPQAPPAAPAVSPPAPPAIGPFSLLDLSFDVMVAGGTSTEPDASLATLQAGGHDPRKRGFTLQQAELGVKGAVDSWLRAEAYLLYFVDPYDGESVFELEEAFATTTGLPYGLELEAGQSLTEFGRQNPTHPHAWDFLDSPVIHTRVFGADGMRGTGVRAGWLAPVPWFAELHVGVQNANGETMTSFLASEESFEERGIGGRPYVERDVASLADVVWLARLAQAWEIGDATTVALGGSALFGPNATGDDGDTRVYGADLVVRWSDAVGGREATELVWQTEYLFRDYAAAAWTDPDAGVALPADTLRDQGFTTHLTWKFAPEWRVGLRHDHATGAGVDYDATTGAALSRELDPFRDDRQRESLLFEWRASEFSRLRLQYSYDRADHLEAGDAHSVWLGLEVSLGSHPAHRF